MANIQVKRQLTRIERELSRVAKHAANHSGITPTEAFGIGTTCMQIIETAAMLMGEAREVQGRKGAQKRLTKRIRKALGYVYP